MKLKTNNKFSKWLFKLACKFRYSIQFPEPTVIYITPNNLELCNVCIKVPEELDNQTEYISQMICYEFAKNVVFRQNIKCTSKFNPEDNTTTIRAMLYILNKKGLEDFYGKY